VMFVSGFQCAAQSALRGVVQVRWRSVPIWNLCNCVISFRLPCVSSVDAAVPVPGSLHYAASYRASFDEPLDMSGASQSIRDF